MTIKSSQSDNDKGLQNLLTLNYIAHDIQKSTKIVRQKPTLLDKPYVERAWSFIRKYESPVRYSEQK